MIDDPGTIANRLTGTAKDTVDQAREIAKEAIADAGNIEEFTAAKVAKSYFRALDLAMTSGMQATKDVLGIVPQERGITNTTNSAEGRRLVADAMEAITRRMLRQASAVIQETADDVDKNPTETSKSDPTKPIPNPNGPSVWVKAMAKLGDIALLGGIELAETALIGPAPFERERIRSATYQAPGSGRRKLVIGAGGITRPGTANPLDANDIRFYVPGKLIDEENPDLGYKPDEQVLANVLNGGQGNFYLSVSPVGQISGMYVGKVEVWTLTGNATDIAPGDTLVDVVDVELPL